METLPADVLRTIVPEWDPTADPPSELTGGYSHRVFALGQRHVVRLAPPDRAHRLRHEALILAELAGRDDVETFRHVLPQVVGEFDVNMAHAENPSHAVNATQSHWDRWRGLVINRFAGVNAFRAWLDASHAVRQSWVRQAVTILRAVHGFGPTTGRRTMRRGDNDAYVAGWYATRIEIAGRDWRSAHQKYLTTLRDRLASALTGKRRALVGASISACNARLDALGTRLGPCPGHGDFHLHNIVVSGAQVTGVIDWEWGGMTEPDADLAHLLRWSLFPSHPADEDLEHRVSPRDFSDVPSAVWEAYPEIAKLAGLEERLFVYLVEHDLHQLVGFPDSTQATERLEAWHAGAVREVMPRGA